MGILIVKEKVGKSWEEKGKRPEVRGETKKPRREGEKMGGQS
jgi:hypothetical protein